MTQNSPDCNIDLLIINSEFEESLDVEIEPIHNFIRVHFTTKVVPAVKIGILETGSNWEHLFNI